MPATGFVKAFAYAQAGPTRNHLAWTGQEGTSALDVRQDSLIALKVDPSDSVVDDPSDSVVDDAAEGQGWSAATFADNTASTDGPPLPQGMEVVAELVSSRPYARNATVWVQVGAFTRNVVTAYDVLVESMLDYRWFLSKVAVDSTGDHG